MPIKEITMICTNIKPSENTCQPFSENTLIFNPEDHLLSNCKIYCTNIIQQGNSPWQRHANLMGYWYKNGQTKISKLQKNVLHYLHQWYFSKGNPAYLKTTNLTKKFGSTRRNTIRAITRLIERGILIRLEYWSNKYQRFRSVLLPKLKNTLKEKLVFQLNKRKYPLSETDTGGCVRYFPKVLKSLHIQNCNIYSNILYTNYLYTNVLSTLNLTSLNYPAPLKRPEQGNLTVKNSVPINMKGTNMQPETKPRRIILKVKGTVSYPSSIDETIVILKKNNFNPTSVPYVAISDLLYYLQNKIFMDYGDNNPNIEPLDLASLFRFSMRGKNKFIEQYDNKLFKMFMRLVSDNKNFNDFNLTVVAKKIIGYWSGCAKSSKDKSRKYVNHNPNLKTKTGFKIWITLLYHFHYTLNYIPGNTFLLPVYEDILKNGIKRLFNYAYVLNLPRKVSFDVILVDHNDSDRFIKCLTLSDDDFYNFVNASKRIFQSRPENEKSLTNFKQIFISSFYPKDQGKGKQRFDQYKPNFARFIEILINRIEKYSENGKRVELSGLKLTAETKQDAPVLYYYMEWLKNEIFSETVFKFDEMFSLQNWNSFIKSFMRIERGYSNYWKIVDRN
jgi:hypothetical protein